MAKDTWRPKAILKPESRITWKTNQEQRYKDMHNKLQGQTNKLELREQPTTERLERIIDIYEISYLAFYTNRKYSENTLFSLSLYGLDRELEDRKQGQESSNVKLDPINQQPHKTELQWLQRILPKELKEFADVFSKMASNKLPPHRLYNYKI